MGGFRDVAVVKSPLANAGDPRDMSSIPGLERSPGEGYGNPLQYSCLEDPLDRGAWQTMESNMTEHSHTHTHTHLKRKKNRR